MQNGLGQRTPPPGVGAEARVPAKRSPRQRLRSGGTQAPLRRGTLDVKHRRLGPLGLARGDIRDADLAEGVGHA